MNDLISRQAAIDAIRNMCEECDSSYCGECRVSFPGREDCEKVLKGLPPVQPEVIPHRNYKYLSDYWCECGWHLGKKGEVKYCAECGRKVNWHG